MLNRKTDSRLIKIIFVLLAFSLGLYVASHYKPWLARVRLGVSTEDTAQSLTKARALAAQGHVIEARKILVPLAAGGANDSITPRALMLLAQMARDAGDLNQAAPHLERVYREFRTSPCHAEAAVAYGRVLEDTGKSDDAARVYEDVRANAPPELRAPALTGLGRCAEKAGDPLRARHLYSQAVADAHWDSGAWHEALALLGRVNVSLIFSPSKTPESKLHTVAKGDSITSIGNALNTTQGLLLRANGMTADATLVIGRQLKYTPKDFRMVIERSRCRLFLVDQNGIFKLYRAGLGEPGNETTPGFYKIGNKQKDPVWHKANSAPIPAGDPRNELGTRWMPLVPREEGLPKDLGIHGTIAPETVGTYCSKGCARLVPEEIEELYDLVVRSTPVTIVETYDPGDAAGKRRRAAPLPPAPGDSAVSPTGAS